MISRSTQYSPPRGVGTLARVWTAEMAVHVLFLIRSVFTVTLMMMSVWLLELEPIHKVDRTDSVICVKSPAESVPASVVMNGNETCRVSQWRSKALRGPGSTVTWGPSIPSAGPKGKNWKPEVLRVEVGLWCTLYGFLLLVSFSEVVYSFLA